MQICNKSKDIIKKTFSAYNKIERLPGYFEGRTIIHIYPQKDTINDLDDEMTGYEDSLLFGVGVFNSVTMTAWTCEDRDEINIPEKMKCMSIRVFKDQSTMITIDQPITIGCFQSLTILPVKKGRDGEYHIDRGDTP